MGLTVTQTDYVNACGVSSRIVSARVAGLPFAREGKVKRYQLADCAHLLGKKYAHVAPELLRRSKDDGATFQGGDEVLGSCKKLEAFLTAFIDGAGDRIYCARTAYFDGLANSTKVSALLNDPERQRLIIIRHPVILRFVLANDRSGLPASREDWGQFAYRFALIHGARGPLLSTIPVAA
jgi:hypothetical protein